MKTNTTQGPWKVAENTGAHVYIRGKDDESDTQTIAKVWLQDGFIDDNAHLIAAAPQMLQALKIIESCLAPEDNDFAALAVRAAIAKAEGRSL